MSSIRVEHPDGSKDTLSLTQGKVSREFGKQDQAKLKADREEVNGISLTEREDEVYLVHDGSDVFGGLLKDIVRKGSKTELVVQSFEQYAKDSKPTPAGQNYDNVNDSKVVNDAIGSVSELSAGTVNNVKSGISFVFSHATQAKKIRKVEEVTGGEVRYNADKTVDYIDKLGSDKSSTVLSPDSQRVIGNTIEVARPSGEERVTHLRVIGAGEGEHQLKSEVTASNYSAGDREIWRVYSNKGIQDQDALDSLANTLINELNTEHIEVDCGIKGADVALGDEFTVDYPEEGLNSKKLRVVELTTIIDKAGKRYSAVLSSRQKSREMPSEKDRQDVQRFNMAVQGVAVPINAGGGRQPVDGTHNYKMQLYYPAEVVYEHRLNVRVVGLPYRAYSSGAASQGSHTHDVTIDSNTGSHTHFTIDEVNEQQGNSATGTGSFQELDLFAPSASGHFGVMAYVWISLTEDSSVDTFYVRINRKSGSDYHPSSTGMQFTQQTGSGTNTGHGNALAIFTPGAGGYSRRLEVKNGDGMNFNWGVIWSVTSAHQHSYDAVETSSSGGSHTHSPDPGITDFSSDFPSNCDVLVNGTSQGASFGDGTSTFTGEVDVSGALNEGQMNTIEVTSDTLGHVQAYVEGDVYRQILGSG